MTAPEYLNPIPPVSIIPFPLTIGVTTAVLLTAFLVVVSHRFDVSQGVLTISILITLGMLGAVAFCLIFTIPDDAVTSGVVGGLTTGFGAVIAYWFGRTSAQKNAPKDTDQQ
jgi:hypothetical protein